MGLAVFTASPKTIPPALGFGIEELLVSLVGDINRLVHILAGQAIDNRLTHNVARLAHINNQRAVISHATLCRALALRRQIRRIIGGGTRVVPHRLTGTRIAFLLQFQRHFLAGDPPDELPGGIPMRRGHVNTQSPRGNISSVISPRSLWERSKRHRVGNLGLFWISSILVQGISLYIESRFAAGEKLHSLRPPHVVRELIRTSVTQQAGIHIAGSPRLGGINQRLAVLIEIRPIGVKKTGKHRNRGRTVSTNHAADIAGQAAEAAREANNTISKLGESSQQIGEVISTIQAIAEQTNLLALNATIEAARAGEAGKGFAVVAEEVKDLAGETGTATENISRQIEKIQQDSTAAIDAITRITKIIEDVNNVSMTIASAVEQQTATTAEMGRSVTEASSGASSLSQQVASFASMAAGASTELRKLSEDVKDLDTQVNELNTEMHKFTIETTK